MDACGENVYIGCFIVYLVQLLVTVIVSIKSKDKAKLAKINKIVKFIQILYYLIGNCIYVVDVVLAVLIHRDFKISEEGVVT